MTVLVIQHAADCGPAHLGRWLVEAGADLAVVHAWSGVPVPGDLAGHTGLLVLGGDMGAYDDDVAPWLPATRTLLAQAVDRQLPTLAVCLGHQLLAVATGGRVQRSPAGRQLGVLPVGLTPAGQRDPLLGPVAGSGRAIHWNDDLVVDLPRDAVELARSPVGVQAMRIGSVVWGVQFHPEVGAAEIAAWGNSTGLGGGVASEQLGQMAAAEPQLHRTWRAMAQRFAAVTVAGTAG